METRIARRLTAANLPGTHLPVNLCRQAGPTKSLLCSSHCDIMKLSSLERLHLYELDSKPRPATLCAAINISLKIPSRAADDSSRDRAFSADSLALQQNRRIQVKTMMII